MAQLHWSVLNVLLNRCVIIMWSWSDCSVDDVQKLCSRCVIEVRVFCDWCLFNTLVLNKRYVNIKCVLCDCHVDDMWCIVIALSVRREPMLRRCAALRSNLGDRSLSEVLLTAQWERQNAGHADQFSLNNGVRRWRRETNLPIGANMIYWNLEFQEIQSWSSCKTTSNSCVGTQNLV